jgi:hypothetical protein
MATSTHSLSMSNDSVSRDLPCIPDKKAPIRSRLDQDRDLRPILDRLNNLVGKHRSMLRNSKQTLSPNIHNYITKISSETNSLQSLAPQLDKANPQVIDNWRQSVNHLDSIVHRMSEEIESGNKENKEKLKNDTQELNSAILEIKQFTDSSGYFDSDNHSNFAPLSIRNSEIKKSPSTLSNKNRHSRTLSSKMPENFANSNLPNVKNMVSKEKLHLSNTALDKIIHKYKETTLNSAEYGFTTNPTSKPNPNHLNKSSCAQINPCSASSSNQSSTHKNHMSTVRLDSTFKQHPSLASTPLGQHRQAVQPESVLSIQSFSEHFPQDVYSASSGTVERNWMSPTPKRFEKEDAGIESGEVNYSEVVKMLKQQLAVACAEIEVLKSRDGSGQSVSVATQTDRLVSFGVATQTDISPNPLLHSSSYTLMSNVKQTKGKDEDNNISASKKQMYSCGDFKSILSNLTAPPGESTNMKSIDSLSLLKTDLKLKSNVKDKENLYPPTTLAKQQQPSLVKPAQNNQSDNLLFSSIDDLATSCNCANNLEMYIRKLNQHCTNINCHVSTVYAQILSCLKSPPQANIISSNNNEVTDRVSRPPLRSTEQRLPSCSTVPLVVENAVFFQTFQSTFQAEVDDIGFSCSNPKHSSEVNPNEYSSNQSASDPLPTLTSYLSAKKEEVIRVINSSINSLSKSTPGNSDQILSAILQDMTSKKSLLTTTCTQSQALISQQYRSTIDLLDATLHSVNILTLPFLK